MQKPKRYTVTAALPYANGGIHLGHLAGAYLPADIYVRYRRLRDNDVLFICGSDEHGVPITLGARREGIPPQQFVDKYHHLMKDSFEKFGISFDIYSRTSNQIHHQTAQEIFLDLFHNKYLLEETSLQYYDEQEKMFLADRYIQGTCPNCGYEKAYGDQCERCGTSLSPKDLINPLSALSGKPPVLRETRHWYLPLQNYEPWLRQWILEDHKNDWKANVYGQCKSWLDNGLQPRAMTRDLEWGVKVPLPGTEGKVLYVWFDAPIGYISATKEYFQNKSNTKIGGDAVNEDSAPVNWELYWKDKETRLIHFIGKDNIVFHCIIFPAILHAHGEYIVPDNVPANEFLNLEGEKLSTSRNWAVWLHEYLEELPGKNDELRYVLTSILPETKDSDFSWKDYQARINNELVAIFGNFVNRTLVLTQNYFEGKVPPAHELNASDSECIAQLTLVRHHMAECIEQYKLRDALYELINLARTGNKYLADNEPWKVIAKDRARVETVLNTSLQVTAHLAMLSVPFLPESSDKIYTMLNIKPLKWDDVSGKNVLEAGHQLGLPSLLFKKIEDEEMDFQLKKLHYNTPAKVTTQDIKTIEDKKPMQAEVSYEQITYDEFAKLQLLVGTIETAEKVKKADKLLQMKINMGKESRTIVSGIAEHFSPEAIIGQQVCVVANLASRKIRGIESKGMILMAEDESGKLKFVMPSEKISDGSKIS